MKPIKLVCIIDDDPIHLFLTNKLIEMTNLVDKTISYKDGKEAFLAIQTSIKNEEVLPDIIFLDLNMPIWDGWQFLEKMQELPKLPDFTTFILTSSENEDDLKKAEKYGLNTNYLIKPINRDMLKNILEKVVKH
jgi:CheY-like chemotaxis protein